MSLVEGLGIPAAPAAFSSVIWDRTHYSLDCEKWVSAMGWISRVGYGEEERWQYGQLGVGVVDGTVSTRDEAFAVFKALFDGINREAVEQGLLDVEY
jgi:hypothetical protein